MSTCEEYFLIHDTADHNSSTVDIDELRDHVDDCEEGCDVDIPDEDDAVLSYYLDNYNDPEFEDFAEKYRGTWDSLEEFVEDFLTEVYGEDYTELVDRCTQMGLMTPELDMIAWKQDFNYDTDSGAVFYAN